MVRPEVFGVGRGCGSRNRGRKGAGLVSLNGKGVLGWGGEPPVSD